MLVQEALPVQLLRSKMRIAFHTVKLIARVHEQAHAGGQFWPVSSGA